MFDKPFGIEPIERVECAGAPRDLGRAQGEAFKHAVRDHVARSGAALRRRRSPVLTAWSSGPVLGAGAGREIIRHYPHLSERMAGLALGADLPLDSLMASLVQPAPSSSAFLNAPAVALASEELGEGGVFAARSLGTPSTPCARWVLRRSRPEVGFASVELTLPWLVSAVAGVNSEGVTAVMARSDVGGGRGAPPILLVQECLQRFASIDGCLDWCLKREAFGRALLFVADVEGGVAAVEFEGSERRVIRPSDGCLIEGVSSAAAAELRKARERHPDPPFDAGSLDWVALAASDGAEGEPRGRDLAGSMSVHLESAARRLSLHRVNAEGAGQFDEPPEPVELVAS